MANMISRILVPTDFSESSDAALEFARAIAERVGASIHLLHVLNEPLLAEGLAAEAFSRTTPSFERSVLDAAKADLSGRADGAASAEVVFGHPADIGAYASKLGADLIVMGTRGRTGIAHLFLGSVAETVVRSAPCPVLTVRCRSRGANETAGAEEHHTQPLET